MGEQFLGPFFFECEDTLRKIYSLTHFFGVATHFITLSSSMRNNVIALRLCSTNQEEEFEVPNITARSQMMIKNPVAATKVFYRLMQKFFQVIVKLPINTFNGKNMACDELMKQEINDQCGAYGHVTALLGVIEEQASGQLHHHGILFGAWNVRVFQQWCHSVAAAKKFQELIDSHITCKIPAHLKANKHNEFRSSLSRIN